MKVFPAVPFTLALEDLLSAVFKAIVGAVGAADRKVVRAIALVQTLKTWTPRPVC